MSKAADPLKILASADTMKVLGVQRPLLQVSNIQYPQKNDTHMQGKKERDCLIEKLRKRLLNRKVTLYYYWIGC